MHKIPKVQNTTLRLVVCALLALVVGSGCTTQTRLGSIIPAHRLSDQNTDEVVLVNIVRRGGPSALAAQIKQGGGPAGVMAVPGVGAPVAAFAAGLAIDFVKSELEKEAEKYEAQFGKKLWLTTRDIGVNGTYIVLTRWVKPKALTLRDSRAYDPEVARVEKAWRQILVQDARIRYQTEAEAFADLSGDLVAIANNLQTAIGDRDEIRRLSLAKSAVRIQGRELAFMFVLEVMPGAGAGNRSGPFTIRPHTFWAWKSKAKVVDFDLGNGWKPWTWVGMLIFKTDSTVNYKVDLSIESLVRGKDTPLATMVNNGPAGPIISNLSQKLKTSPETLEFEDPVGGWFDVPGYPNVDSQTGYFTLGLQVTESDASNVKKKLTKAADSLEKNREGIIEKIGSQF